MELLTKPYQSQRASLQSTNTSLNHPNCLSLNIYHPAPWKETTWTVHNQWQSEEVSDRKSQHSQWRTCKINLKDTLLSSANYFHFESANYSRHEMPLLSKGTDAAGWKPREASVSSEPRPLRCARQGTKQAPCLPGLTVKRQWALQKRELWGWTFQKKQVSSSKRDRESQRETRSRTIYGAGRRPWRLSGSAGLPWPRAGEVCLMSMS